MRKEVRHDLLSLIPKILNKITGKILDMSVNCTHIYLGGNKGEVGVAYSVTSLMKRQGTYKVKKFN